MVGERVLASMLRERNSVPLPKFAGAMEDRVMFASAFADVYQMFVEIFSEALCFVETEWGFSREVGSVGTFWVTMKYIRDDIAIEFEFDVRELTVDVIVYCYPCKEGYPRERVGILSLFPELGSRVNSETMERVQSIQKLRKRAWERYDTEMIREWLVREAELYAFWLSYAGQELIARARARLGLPAEGEL